MKPNRRRALQLIGGSGLLIGNGIRDVLAQRSPPAAITLDRARPQMTTGVMSGDVTDNRAMLWSRADRVSRMLVDVATTEAMTDARRVEGPVALARNDFTARLDLSALAPGQTYFYRIRFQDLANPRATSEPLVGRFRTPHDGKRDIVFAFSGDEAGQGWGIDEAWGGYRVYESMRRCEPDFFIHSGDQIYADVPMQAEVVLDDGTLWKNIVTPAKTKVAETLADYRGNFAYNFLDANKRRFCAEVPMLVQWDDHDVRNNWYPGQTIGPEDTRYNERDLSTLARYAKQALFEYNPMRFDESDPDRVYRVFRMGPMLDVFMLDERSYRGANSPNRQTRRDHDADFLGSAQVQWLKRSLKASRATWKLIASDMPLSIVVPDGNPDVPKGNFEAWANADDGAPAGRELEVAELLRFIKRHDIRNVVWVTADVHYASATEYRPEQGRFTDFKPFWEFVGGPLHAGTFGPGPIDHTFGPDVKFVGIPTDMKQNRSPREGLQFFGIGKIDARSKAMTVSLHDIEGKVLYRVELPVEI
jgi:alkaline phosphatase D